MIDISKVFICKIGWLEKYKGAEDPPAGKDQFLQDPDWGYEMFNFAPYKGRMYGYVQPTAKNQLWFKPQIKIEELGTYESAEEINDIFVVWVAKEPVSGDIKIVGYYNNATVLRKIDRLVFSERIYPNKILHTFRIHADKVGCRLLTIEERATSPTLIDVDTKKSVFKKSPYLFPTEDNKSLRESVCKFLAPFLEPKEEEL